MIFSNLIGISMEFKILLKSRTKKSPNLVLGALVLNSIMLFSQLYPQALRINSNA